MHLMTLKHWNEAKFFVCSVYGEDHKSCFAFPQPALMFQHLVYRYACSWVGSKSTLLPRVTLADGHETKKEGSAAECNVVTNMGLSRQP